MSIDPVMKPASSETRAETSELQVTAAIRHHDREAFDVDITQCRFAEFFHALGEPELGALLICDAEGSSLPRTFAASRWPLPIDGGSHYDHLVWEAETRMGIGWLRGN